MSLTGFAVLIAGIVAFSANASAQSLPTQRVVTLDMAQTMAQEALATCRGKGLKVTVLVVDALNMPKALLRDDGATPSSTETAKMKATATMLYQRPSGTTPGVIPGTVSAAGALPIKIGDVTIGAIAVSGAPNSDQDAACATAALDKVANQLK
jgi:uncharacterized protein GlcG (DUF336 family)